MKSSVTANFKIEFEVELKQRRGQRGVFSHELFVIHDNNKSTASVSASVSHYETVLDVVEQRPCGLRLLTGIIHDVQVISQLGTSQVVLLRIIERGEQDE